MTRKLQIAVVGDANPSPEVIQMAEEVGQLLANNEAVVVCGGLGGVMAAVARGAASQGGITVGVLPTYDAMSGNSSLSIVIPSGAGHARNVIVVASGDAVIALPGSYGTLSEVALALKLGKTVIGVNAWADIKGVQTAKTPNEAVTLALAAAHRLNS
jgi:uncharacterized protein (TIGR00725 family)